MIAGSEVNHRSLMRHLDIGLEPTSGWVCFITHAAREDRCPRSIPPITSALLAIARGSESHLWPRRDSRRIFPQAWARRAARSQTEDVRRGARRDHETLRGLAASVRAVASSHLLILCCRAAEGVASRLQVRYRSQVLASHRIARASTVSARSCRRFPVADAPNSRNGQAVDAALAFRRLSSR